MQPVPKAAYRSDFRENTNFCPQRDSNLGPLAQQASVLPLDHCVFSYGALHVSLSHNFLLRAFPYKAHFNLLSNVNVLAAAHCLKACMIEPPMCAELGGVKCQLTWLPDNLLCRCGCWLSHNEAGCSLAENVAGRKSVGCTEKSKTPRVQEYAKDRYGVLTPSKTLADKPIETRPFVCCPLCLSGASILWVDEARCFIKIMGGIEIQDQPTNTRNLVS